MYGFLPMRDIHSNVLMDTDAKWGWWVFYCLYTNPQDMSQISERCGSRFFDLHVHVEKKFLPQTRLVRWWLAAPNRRRMNWEVIMHMFSPFTKWEEQPSSYALPSFSILMQQPTRWAGWRTGYPLFSTAINMYGIYSLQRKTWHACALHSSLLISLGNR